MSHAQVFLPFTKLDNGSPFHAYCKSVSYLRLNKDNIDAGHEICLPGNNSTYEIQLSVSTVFTCMKERTVLPKQCHPQTV